MERLTVLMEKIMANRTNEIILGIIALIAPVYFFKTIWAVWFGPIENFIGFKAEKNTWLIMTIVDSVGFLTTLPSRKKGRVVQIVMFLWAVDLLLVYLATLIR